MKSEKKKFKNQEEKFKDFYDSMSLIDWKPFPASFQLSPNKQWGRHDLWRFLTSQKRETIQNEIWRHWGLVAILDDGAYCYFGQPWERTKIVEFIGDIEKST